MKKLYTLLFCSALILGTINLNAQTTVPSGAVSGIWTLAGSPYLIQGAIMIANGTTLSIDPGVTVNFQGSYKFLVLGRLLAIGNVGDSITFTASNTANGWLGIRFDNTSAANDTSKFVYCKLIYGKATATAPNNSGGGFYFDSFSKAIISHSRISNCSANFFGGGIYCNNSSKPSISNNLITNNTAAAGGGIYCYNSSNPVISYNIITHNTATNNAGGGIYAYNTSSPTILNNTISYNNSGRGGGIFCISSSTTISNNIISYNQASNALGGGGIYTSGSGTSETISYNIISNNSTNSDGGGMFCGSQTMISNNVISNNTSSNNGGGIYCFMGNPTIVNNTISNNTALQGNSLFCTSSSSPVMRNTILWNTNPSNQIYLDDEGSDPNIYYCDIQGGQPAIGLNNNVFYLGTYTNNINGDPIFVAPSGGNGNGFNGITANWSLQGGSPCINAGNPLGTYPSIDIFGNPRVSGGIIDLGAYEVLSTEIKNNVYQSAINFYPNPFTEQTTIVFLEEQKNTTIKIMDVVGKEIITINFTGKQLTVEKGDMQKGVCFLQIINEKNNIINKKIIIQ